MSIVDVVIRLSFEPGRLPIVPLWAQPDQDDIVLGGWCGLILRA